MMKKVCIDHGGSPSADGCCQHCGYNPEWPADEDNFPDCPEAWCTECGEGLEAFELELGQPRCGECYVSNARD